MRAKLRRTETLVTYGHRHASFFRKETRSRSSILMRLSEPINRGMIGKQDGRDK